MLTSKEENIRTLANRLGIEPVQASMKLDVKIVFTTDPKCSTGLLLESHLSDLLSRTFKPDNKGPKRPPDIEIVIGNSSPLYNARHLFVKIFPDKIHVSTKSSGPTPPVELHPIFVLIGACYAAAKTFELALDDNFGFPIPEPSIFEFKQLGVHPKQLENLPPLRLEKTYLAGAGAVGCAFIWGLQCFEFHGVLNIADPDLIEDGNLNRCLIFDERDIGKPKAEILAKKTENKIKELKCVPHVRRFEDLGILDRNLEKLIVGVDSRGARRSLQKTLPLEVFDASTTNITEVIIHTHKQPNSHACLCCIYAPSPQEDAFEKHIAAHLGLTLEEVKNKIVSPKVAKKISKNIKQVNPKEIIGLSLDSVFKQLCGQALLKDQEGQQVLAPFAFVSGLAGALLALRFVLNLTELKDSKLSNYWRVHPWIPKSFYARLKSKNPSCEFCGNPELIAEANKIWFGSKD